MRLGVVEDKYIIAYFVLFGVVTIITVIAQHTAAEQYRPTTIIKKIASGISGKFKRRSQRNRMMTDQRNQWLARPCHVCGHSGQFHSTYHEEKESSGTVIVQLAVILFIITPLTCGLGLLILPFMLLGGKKIPMQQCPNCGTVRPL